MNRPAPSGERARADAPVRVLHVLWRLSRSGGVQTVVRMLIASVDPAAVAIAVVTARPRLDDDALDALPVDVIGLGHGGAHLRWRDRRRVAAGVRREVRRTRPDVVHLHSGTVWMGVLARFATARRAWVLEVHDAPGSGRHGRVTDLVEGWWVRLTRAHVLCHSTSVAQAVRSRWHLRDGRVTVFPLAVDVERFRAAGAGRADARARLGLAPEAVVVAAVGRLVPSKRLEVVLRALAGLPDHVVGLLVGAGTERDRLESLAGELGIADRLLMTGHLTDDDLAAAVGAADVLVSASDYEGFGLSLVEGMAAGLPVVATAVGGVADVVANGETGVLVAPGDVVALRDALERFMADAGERAAFGAAGRARAVEHFSPARLAADATALYRRLADR